jgi:hypothetical protein
MRAVDVRLAGLVVAAAALAAAAPAFAANPVSSSAYALYAKVASQGTGTSLPPVAAVAGTSVAKFDKRANVPYVSEALGLVSAGKLIGEVTVTAAGVLTHASSSGAAGATVTAEADTSIGSLQMVIELLPPPGSTQPPGAPLMTLSASKLVTALSDTRTLPWVGALTGTASFGSLIIGGSLFGATPLSFSGAAPANTVLYDDRYITVTLNKQLVTGTVDCTPECQFIPASMDADGLSVYINGAKVQGTSFFADLLVGNAAVQIP